jgi:hypothetical protein
MIKKIPSSKKQKMRETKKYYRGSTSFSPLTTIPKTFFTTDM